MIMLDKLQCIQIYPLIVILYNTSRLQIHFKFHINLALKFHNLSCIINNFSSKFLKPKVKNCYAKAVLIITGTSQFLLMVSCTIPEY